MSESFDLIVLGSGPGGYVAAIRGAQLGLRVAIVERERLGGVCLNWGCIPTKTLLRSAEVLHLVKSAESFGLLPQAGGFDLDKIVARSRKVADQLNAGVASLMRKHKITVIEGHGRLAGTGTLEIAEGGQNRQISAPHIIVATGARARNLPSIAADCERIWTYRSAMTPSELPSKLLIVGSGAIGLEFASFYADLGVKVTVAEALERILPLEDAEVSKFVAKEFSKRGIKVREGTAVEALEKQAAGILATFKDADGIHETEEFSHAIIAIGVEANTDDIGLNTVGLPVQGGFINVDGFGRTSVEGIYAIGDVAGAPCLAHKAMHEGVICAEAIAGQTPHPIDRSAIPNCTYARPQVASIGLTEAKALAAGLDIKVGRFPLLGNGKAIAIGETGGFVKTIFDAESGELLGAHMVGADVTELIEGFSIGKTLEATEAELMQTIFPHPTLSEAMHESTLAAFGRALHI